MNRRAPTVNSETLFVDLKEERQAPSVVVTRRGATAIVIVGYTLLGIVGWALFPQLDAALNVDSLRDRRAEQSTMIFAIFLAVLAAISLYSIYRRPRHG